VLETFQVYHFVCGAHLGLVFFFFQFYWHKVRKNQKEEDPGQTGQEEEQDEAQMAKFIMPWLIVVV